MFYELVNQLSNWKGHAEQYQDKITTYSETLFSPVEISEQRLVVHHNTNVPPEAAKDVYVTVCWDKAANTEIWILARFSDEEDM